MGTTPVKGFTQSYTDPSSGINLPEAWIELSSTLYSPSNYVLVVVDIYKDLSSRNSGMRPVFPSVRYQSDFNDTNWNTYFDDSVMNEQNKSIQKQSILFLQNNISIGTR